MLPKYSVNNGAYLWLILINLGSYTLMIFKVTKDLKGFFSCLTFK